MIIIMNSLILCSMVVPAIKQFYWAVLQSLKIDDQIITVGTYCKILVTISMLLYVSVTLSIRVSIY